MTRHFYKWKHVIGFNKVRYTKFQKLKNLAIANKNEGFIPIRKTRKFPHLLLKQSMNERKYASSSYSNNGGNRNNYYDPYDESSTSFMYTNSNHNNNNNNNSPDDFYFRQLQQTNGNYDAAEYDIIGQNKNSGSYDNDNDFDDYIRAMENKLNIHSSR